MIAFNEPYDHGSDKPKPTLIPPPKPTPIICYPGFKPKKPGVYWIPTEKGWQVVSIWDCCPPNQ